MRQLFPLVVGLALATIATTGAQAEVIRLAPEIVVAAADQAGAPTILRGSTAKPAPATTAASGPSRVQVVGGRKLWVVDPETKAVRSCVNRNTSTVGVREIRCTSGTVGRYRRGFGRSFKP